MVNIDEAYTKAIALLALLLIFLLNVFGLKKDEKTQLFIVSVSLISLIVIIVLGFSSFDTKLTEPVFSDGTNGFIAGVAFLYISYAGVTKIAAIAGEIKNIELGKWSKENNPLKNAPHTHLDLINENWDFPYSKKVAFFPFGLKVSYNKYWPPFSRIDNAHGDRNLICVCPPIENYA